MISNAGQIKNVKRLRVYTTEGGHVKCQDMETGESVAITGFMIDYDCRRDGPRLRGIIGAIDLEIVPGEFSVFRRIRVPIRELLLDAIRERWYRLRHRIRRRNRVEIR